MHRMQCINSGLILVGYYLEGMKIAVTGSHNTGKTTLVGELHDLLPNYSIVDEPYYLLEEGGHVFPEMPGIEDFELQLERSIRCLEDCDGDTIFDRCPLDLLAYLICIDESVAYDVEPWLPKVRDSLQMLDLIVFVPIEIPDRIDFAAGEFRDLRTRVDEELREKVMDDRWNFGFAAIEVIGSPSERAGKIVTFL